MRPVRASVAASFCDSSMRVAILDGAAELPGDDGREHGRVLGVADARREREARDRQAREENRPHDGLELRVLGQRVLVLDDQDLRRRVRAEHLAHLALGRRAKGGVVVDREPPGGLRRERHPSVSGDLRQELRQEVEEALEVRCAGERAELGGHDGVEEGLVEVARQTIADIDAPSAQLHEEAVVPLLLLDGLREGPHELARPPLENTRSGAGAVRPEAAARLVALDAEDHRHVGRGGLGAEQPTELNPRDARHPEVGDDGGRWRGESHVRPRGCVARLVDQVALGAQAPPEDLATRVARIDEQYSLPRIHNGPT